MYVVVLQPNDVSVFFQSDYTTDKTDNINSKVLHAGKIVFQNMQNFFLKENVNSFFNVLFSSGKKNKNILVKGELIGSFLIEFASV